MGERLNIKLDSSVYPDLVALLSAVSGDKARAEALRLLAEDGRRWRRGLYLAGPQETTVAQAFSTQNNRQCQDLALGVTVDPVVFPELARELTTLAARNKRVEYFKTLAEDGRRWRAGIYSAMSVHRTTADDKKQSIEITGTLSSESHDEYDLGGIDADDLDLIML